MIRRRKLLEALEKHLDHKQYTIITGARQVGKTSLLKLIFEQQKNKGEKVFFLSLEDRRILDALNDHPEKILDFLSSKPIPILQGDQEKPVYLLLDEIQYAKEPTHFLKYLYDTYESNLKIIATGSSAFFIDKKFQDSLAGRKRIFQLFPLSFEEFLSFRGAEHVEAEILALRNQDGYQSLRITELQAYFREYMTYGGYPAVVLEPENQEKEYLLEELKNAYIKRDLLESGIGREGKFYHLLQILADQIGNLVNKNNLGSSTQMDGKTVDHYLYILQKCYHVQLVRPFYRNIRKELSKMPKIYFNDLGLRNALLNRFGDLPTRADKGALLENYFFLQLRQSYSLDQLHYWRTTDKHEVDFVIEESYGQGKSYEIKWNPLAFKQRKYQKFTDTYPTFPLSCLSAEDFYLL